MIIKDNLFENNQAYLSGNAVYVRNTRQYKDEIYDEVCGASFYANGNTFVNNTSVIHSSNGGAISLECDFVALE